jgi:hypothetical protein
MVVMLRVVMRPGLMLRGAFNWNLTRRCAWLTVRGSAFRGLPLSAGGHERGFQRLRLREAARLGGT